LLGASQKTANGARQAASLYRRPASQLAHEYKKLYISCMADTKPIEFRGKSLDDLRAFPLSARREAGHQLDLVQNGQEPHDWKPMNTVGQGVKEIRIRDATGAFRIIYVAKFADAVYVLHCFQKKTAKTSKTDLDLAAKRYRDLLKELDP
jgi:phage-related protein